LLDQDLIGGWADYPIAADESELPQPLGIPTFRSPARRLGHDQAAAGL
jgi:hypothetical protein